MLTESERQLIAKVKAAHEAATPGEWVYEFFVIHNQHDVSHGPIDDASSRFSVLEDLSAADAQSIVIAHNCIPSLLAIIERLDTNYGKAVRLVRKVARRLNSYSEESDVLDFPADMKIFWLT